MYIFTNCIGVRYVPGGVKSGFKHYDPEDAPHRLFHVKGKRNVRVREVMVQEIVSKKEVILRISLT
jgi:hypothetical protein